MMSKLRQPIGRGLIGYLTVLCLAGVLALSWVLAQGKDATFALHSAGLPLTFLQRVLFAWPLPALWLVGALALSGAGILAGLLARGRGTVAVVIYAVLLFVANALMYYLVLYAPFAARIAS